MASAFRNLFDSIIEALGGGFDKPPQPSEPQTPQQPAVRNVPATGALCRVCKVMPAKPEYFNEFCDDDCVRREIEQDLADRMDAWHDQFQERFSDD
ncbi:MAG TPA: hypothetical protein VGW12_06775 [Pyrinomonadaceae bacterium]|nr:hypothetical protein [Pyrinomonadaceae bacterium]